MIPASLTALGSLPIKMLPAESWVLPAQKAKASNSFPKRSQNLDFLSYSGLSKIVEFLSPNDLRSLSCSCKNLAKIIPWAKKITTAAKILNSTPWKADFDVIGSFNVDKIENARFIFLGDDHCNKNCQRANAHLISFLAGKMPIAIFVEGIPSMELLQNPAMRKKHYMLDNLMSSVQFYGWDKDLSKFAAPKLLDVWTLEIDGPKELCKDKVKVLNHSIRECLFILDSIASNNPELMPGYSTNELLKSCHSQTKETRFHLLDASKLAAFYQRLITQVDSSPFSPDSLSDLKKKVNGIRFVLLLQNITSLVNERKREIIEATFPERVQENIITVQKVDQLQREGKLPLTAVFIEGAGHFREVPRRRRRPELCSLKSFYQEISKHKAIVLCPKSVGVFDL